MKTYKVISITHLTPRTFLLKTDRPQVEIRAGQCFNVGIPGMGINREYSMYSPADAPYLEFLVRSVEDGMVSSRLQELNAGDLVEIDGPYGEFCIQRDNVPYKLFLISSGTGIAPFHSFVKTFTQLDYLILHGIRHADEKYGCNDYDATSYLPCISKNLSGPSMRVTDFLRANPPKAETIIYLCGNRNMIVDSVQILLDHGVGGDQIITEVFF
jgi:ferredoxin-NADP reductase